MKKNQRVKPALPLLTDKSSDDTSDVIFYHRKTLEKRITKSNQALMSHLKTNSQVQRKF